MIKDDLLFNVTAECPVAQVFDQTIQYVETATPMKEVVTKKLYPRTVAWLKNLFTEQDLIKAEKIFTETQMAGFSEIKLSQLKYKVRRYPWTKLKEILNYMVLGSFPMWAFILIKFIYQLAKRFFRRKIPVRRISYCSDPDIAQRCIAMERVRVLNPALV